MSVPVGWTIINKVEENIHSGPSPDDLMAIADAIREVGKRPEEELSEENANPSATKNNELGRRGHLRAIPN
jgi:hypothetical protein